MVLLEKDLHQPQNLSGCGVSDSSCFIYQLDRFIAMGAKQRKTTNKETVDEGSNEKVDVGQEIDKALGALAKSQASMMTLYDQWKTQLFRMGFLVMLFVIHQAQQPTIPCLKEIKYWNQIKGNGEETIGGFQSVVLILSDSVVELLGLFCASMLIWMLYLPIRGSYFSSIQYRLSCISVPLTVWQFYENRNIGCLQEDHATIMKDLLPERRDRPFPIIIVFHTIVSLCLFFMQYHSKRMDENIQTLLKLKEKLTEQRQKLSSKKKE